MDRTERFYIIDRLLRSHRGISLKKMMEELEVSRATIRRDLEYMRDRMAAPIVWDRVQRGYRYESMDGEDERYVLPGLWFNASEIYALLTMNHLLSRLKPGLLESHIEPLKDRVRRLLGSGDHSAKEVERRIHILHIGARQVDSATFEIITSAVLRRRRLLIRHLNRRTGTHMERIVSPQRLVYYRDNWYMDSWCHSRNALRSFSVDAIEHIVLLENESAKEMSDEQLEKLLATGYGIFGGENTNEAVIRFAPRAARWVSRERWHSQQRSSYEKDGSYLLTVPYSNETELIMDILRHGADAEVVSPMNLRRSVIARLQEANKLYS